MVIGEGNHLILGMAKAGAKAYMTKDVRVEELVKAIALVNAGGIIISPPMAAKLLHEFTLLDGHDEVSRQRYDSLSKREREVLNLVAKGATNAEIGTTLFITENTVKTHMRKIIDKSHVRNRQQAAALVLGKRLVSNAG